MPLQPNSGRPDNLQVSRHSCKLPCTRSAGLYWLKAKIIILLRRMAIHPRGKSVGMYSGHSNFLINGCLQAAVIIPDQSVPAGGGQIMKKPAFRRPLLFKPKPTLINHIVRITDCNKTNLKAFLIPHPSLSRSRKLQYNRDAGSGT